MQFGAHVSSSGGIDTAIDRIEAMGGDCVQVFTQSPRMWRPTAHTPEAVERFRARRAEAGIGGVVVHALYLCNLAGAERRDLREVRPGLAHHGRCSLRDRGGRRHLPRRLASRRGLRRRARAHDRGARADPRALLRRHVAADGELGRLRAPRSAARSASSRRSSSASTAIPGSASASTRAISTPPATT